MPNSLLLLTLSVIHYSNDEESDAGTAQLNITPEAAAETVETPDRDCRSATTAAMPDRMTVRPPAPIPDNYLVSLHQCNLKTLKDYKIPCAQTFLHSLDKLTKKIECSYLNYYSDIIYHIIICQAVYFLRYYD